MYIYIYTYITLHYPTLHCITLHCITLHYICTDTWYMYIFMYYIYICLCIHVYIYIYYGIFRCRSLIRMYSTGDSSWSSPRLRADVAVHTFGSLTSIPSESQPPKQNAKKKVWGRLGRLCNSSGFNSVSHSTPKKIEDSPEIQKLIDFDILWICSGLIYQTRQKWPLRGPSCQSRTCSWLWEKV